MQYEIQQIINVANQLIRTDKTGASTGEIIAAAFVLNNMKYLPDGYSVVEAWDRIEDWQRYVIAIRRDYLHLIELE